MGQELFCWHWRRQPRVENLVVEAAGKKGREPVYQAMYKDPLTSAACSPEEIKTGAAKWERKWENIGKEQKRFFRS